jgi:spermidine synthase
MQAPIQSRMLSRTADHSRFFPLLLLLFAGSGCAALIYEIVWYQLLQLAIGSTAVSLGVVLATFMGGLCIGSAGFSRVGSERENPLKIYAFLELGIAACAIVILFGIPYVDRIYIVGAEHGLPGMLLRAFFAGVCLLPPTILMGATLPAIVRWIGPTPRGVSQWGFLYGGNTVGAVFGCLFTGFYLLRVYNIAVATYVAMAINIAIAVVSLRLASQMTGAASEPDSQVDSRPDSLNRESESARPIESFANVGDCWTVYATIAASGACALGAEVVWTRLMGMMMGNTVYVFSIILAVFLVGLALGSGIGSLILQAVPPRLALGICQILITSGIAWTAFMIAKSLPYWPINPLLALSPWSTFQLDLLRCLWAILPPTILWGASFPLALASVAKPGEDPGRQVGAIYAANTFGAIIGALSVSLALVPWIGTQQSQRVLLILSAGSALFVLVPYIRAHRSVSGAFGLIVSMLLVGLLAASVHAVPGELIAYGRRMSVNLGQSDIIFTKEGRNSSVAISQWPDGSLGIDVNGHVEATNYVFDMKLQRMVGHLPALLHPNPKSVLGIGFGAGVSAGTFTRYPGIQKITVCEIEPIIPPISTYYFAKENYGVLNNPRMHIVYDDARHYLLTTREKFDIIASDPLDVFVKGTAALYSLEYFEAVKRHLNPGGYFTLYVPLYETDEKTIRSELATFFQAFPNGTIWANTRNGQGYDMVFLGQVEPLKINLDEVQRRFESPEFANVRESMEGIEVPSPVDLFSTFAGQESDLHPWLQGAEINRDRDLRLQYLAGWGIDSRIQEYLYSQMLKYRHTPENLFIGSPRYRQALMGMLPSQNRNSSQQ